MKQDRCRRVVDVLPEYQAGVLPERQQERVAAHLAECASCRGELSALERTGTLLSATGPRRPARDLWLGIAGQLSDRRAQRPWWSPLVPTGRAWTVAGVAVLVLAIVLAGVVLRPHTAAVTDLGTHLAAEADADAPTYARWHTEASLTSALADRYALAFLVSSGTGDTKEAHVR